MAEYLKVRGNGRTLGSIRLLVDDESGDPDLRNFELQERRIEGWRASELDTAAGVSPGPSGHQITALWQGTQAEYDVLTPDATTLYVIVEDV